MTRGRTPNSESVEAVYRELTGVLAALRSRMRGGLAEHGLTIPQILVLKTLAAQGPIPFHTLARTLSVTPANITGIVDRLERAGLVRRRRGREDRRTILVELTPSGKRRFNVFYRAGVDALSELFQGWSEAELAKLRRMLAKVRSPSAPR